MSRPTSPSSACRTCGYCAFERDADRGGRGGQVLPAGDQLRQLDIHPKPEGFEFVRFHGYRRGGRKRQVIRRVGRESFIRCGVVLGHGLGLPVFDKPFRLPLHLVAISVPKCYLSASITLDAARRFRFTLKVAEIKKIALRNALRIPQGFPDRCCRIEPYAQFCAASVPATDARSQAAICSICSGVIFLRGLPFSQVRRLWQACLRLSGLAVPFRLAVGLPFRRPASPWA